MTWRRRIIDQGLLPHCISTDLTVPGRLNTVHSMTEIMTRFLGLGFTLEQVVTMSTANPARAIGAEQRLGSLAVDRQADISVLDLSDGDWVVYDVLGAGLRVNKAFTPVLTVKRGQVFTPEWGPRPWGWEPDRWTAWHDLYGVLSRCTDPNLSQMSEQDYAVQAHAASDGAAAGEPAG